MRTSSQKWEHFSDKQQTNDMKKNLKYVLVAAVVGTGAYLWWKSKQASKPKSFANLTKKVSTKDCTSTPEVVQDAGGTCSLACDSREGDLIILQRPVPCPTATL